MSRAVTKRKKTWYTTCRKLLIVCCFRPYQSLPTENGPTLSTATTRVCANISESEPFHRTLYMNYDTAYNLFKDILLRKEENMLLPSTGPAAFKNHESELQHPTTGANDTLRCSYIERWLNSSQMHFLQALSSKGGSPMPKSALVSKLYLGPACGPNHNGRTCKKHAHFCYFSQWQLLQKLISTFSTASISLLHIPWRRCSLQVAIRGISATVTPCTLQRYQGEHAIFRTSSYSYGENLILLINDVIACGFKHNYFGGNGPATCKKMKVNECGLGPERLSVHFVISTVQE